MNVATLSGIALEINLEILNTEVLEDIYKKVGLELCRRKESSVSCSSSRNVVSPKANEIMKRLVEDIQKRDKSLNDFAYSIRRKFMELGYKDMDDIYKLPPKELVSTKQLTLSSVSHIVYVLKRHGYNYEEHWNTSIKKMQDLLREIKKERKMMAAA